MCRLSAEDPAERIPVDSLLRRARKFFSPGAPTCFREQGERPARPHRRTQGPMGLELGNLSRDSRQALPQGVRVSPSLTLTVRVVLLTHTPSVIPMPAAFRRTGRKVAADVFRLIDCRARQEACPRGGAATMAVAMGFSAARGEGAFGWPLRCGHSPGGHRGTGSVDCVNPFGKSRFIRSGQWRWMGRPKAGRAGDLDIEGRVPSSAAVGRFSAGPHRPVRHRDCPVSQCRRKSGSR